MAALVARVRCTQPLQVAAAAQRGRTVAVHHHRSSRAGFPLRSLSSRSRCQTLSRSLRVSASMNPAMGGGEPEVFPRLKERDPYKKLGVSQEATYEEIQEARNYLIEVYGADQKSAESIEGAFDKIISQKLRVRKKSGISLKPKKDEGKDAKPGFLSKYTQMFDKPEPKVIMQRFFVFALIGAWSILQASENGPAFQVACACIACAYFINTKRQGKALAFAVGVTLLALFAGWLIGTLIPLFLPVFFPPSLSPETTCALFSFVTLWFTSTFLK